MRGIGACLALLLSFATGAYADNAAADLPQRVVSLGGSVTEIVYALDQEHALVGSDLSSIYPQQATELPRVGYYRSLPLEGLVSLQPDLILASEQAGPREVLARVEQLGIRVQTVSDNGTLPALYSRIRDIGQALGVAEQGRTLAHRVQTGIEDAIADAQAEMPDAPAVSAVMLLKRTTQMQAAGSGTTAGNLLELAGLHNAVHGQQGYKPISAEALAALQPELIITTSSSVEALGGQETFLAGPGISLTPAAKRSQILIMDDMLILGLGPRTASAIQTLMQARNKAAAAREAP